MEIIDKLRAEVMRDASLGERFEDMLDDDRTFVDSEVGALARRRGIELTAPSPAVIALRKEVMQDWGNGDYAAMLEEDQDLVDHSVRQLAHERGISLD